MSDIQKRIRADKAEYERRLFIVQGWLIDGVQSALIIRQILTSSWCTSKRQAERILQQARDAWTEIPEADLRQKRRLKIAELEQLARSLKEVHKGSPAGIRAIAFVQKEIIKLEGLAPATRLEVTGKNGQPVAVRAVQELSDNQFHEIVKMINEKAGAH